MWIINMFRSMSVVHKYKHSERFEFASFILENLSDKDSTLSIKLHEPTHRCHSNVVKLTNSFLSDFVCACSSDSRKLSNILAGRIQKQIKLKLKIINSFAFHKSLTYWLRIFIFQLSALGYQSSLDSLN